MGDDSEIKQLLTEIRDNQKLALEKQTEQLKISQQQLDRANSQVEESIELQRFAIRRFKTVSLIAIPGIAFCFGMILYLVIRYF